MSVAGLASGAEPPRHSFVRAAAGVRPRSKSGPAAEKLKSGFPLPTKISEIRTTDSDYFRLPATSVCILDFALISSAMFLGTSA